MNIVSTLCATTTVGAAAVGYTFGIPQTSAPADCHETRAQAGPLHNDNRRIRQLSWNKLRPKSEVITSNYPNLDHLKNVPGPRHGTSIQILRQETVEEQNSVDQTASDNVFRRDRETQFSTVQSFGEDSFQQNPRRSRPASWALSQTSSPPSSVHPSSITPFIPLEPLPLPPGPNKLVKLSASQSRRSVSAGLLPSEQTSKRPITSRQRNAMLATAMPQAPQTSSKIENTIDRFSSLQQNDKKRYRHYFQVSVSHDSRLGATQGRTRSATPQGLRQIRPHETLQPVLLLGNSVEASDNSCSRTLDTNKLVKQQSNVGSSFNIINRSSSPSTSSVTANSGDAQIPSRRSFSISDLLSFRTGTDESKSARRRLQRPLSQRITSAPLLSNVDSGQTSHLYRSQNPKTDSTPAKDSLISHAQDLPVITPISDQATARQDLDSTAAASAGNASPAMFPGRLSGNLFDSPTTMLSSSSFDPTRSVSQRSRRSATPSELASSNIESDGDGRVFSSGDEDDADMQSETVYDSVRTDATRKSTTFLGTMFDKDPSIEGEDSDLGLIHRHHPRGSPTSLGGQNDVITEEDETLLLASDRYDGHHPYSSHSSRNAPDRSSLLHDSGLRRRQHLTDWSSNDEHDVVSVEEGSSSSDDLSETHSILRHEPQDASSAADFLSLRVHEQGGNSQSGGTSSTLQNEGESKINVFDWSEQPHTDRVLSSGAPRPCQTVHGRRNRQHRESRSSGRRAPSGPHARSRSVPALIDHGEGRTSTASKFGTWDVGSKAATEDWDEDFALESQAGGTSPDVRSVPSQPGEQQAKIKIPEFVLKHQTNVIANVGLLKEWGLLIEELKELRGRAGILGVNIHEHQRTFDGVDAMIDLADHEHREEIGGSSRTRSSSPSKDWNPEEFENITTAPSATTRAEPQALEGHTRPRKNSEAIARSVITAIQQRKAPAEEPKGVSPERDQTTAVSTSSKLPFDKGTLKHMLPHLQVLLKSLKTILRTAEGIEDKPTEHALSRMFHPPDENECAVQAFKCSRVRLHKDEEEEEEDWTVD